MKFKLALLFVIISSLSLSFTSCNILSSFGNSGNPASPSPVSLVNPAVGQVSKYLRFSHECFYCRTDAIREFQPDTLILKLLAVENRALVFEERISKGSLSFRDSAHSAKFGVAKPSEVLDYRLEIIDGNLVFTQQTAGRFKSHLFANISSQAYPLTGLPEILIQLNNWKAPTCTCNMLGISGSFTQLGKFYAGLNLIIEQEVMAADGEGLATFYSFEHGLVQTYRSNPWTGYSLGWAKLD